MIDHNWTKGIAMTTADVSLEGSKRFRSSNFHIWFMRIAKVILVTELVALIFLSTDGFFGLYESPGHKEYRLAAESVEVEASTLAREHRAAELVRRIELFETEDLAPLKSLVRIGAADRENLLQAANEHPYIAYALLMKNIDVTIRREETYLAARHTRLEEMRRFTR